MTVLAAHEVTFGYRRGAPVLRDVSVEIGPGVTVLLGPNGAGKSTLVRLLSGIACPWEGRIDLDGKAVGSLTACQRARRVSYVPQRPEVSAAFSVEEVVALGRYALGPGRSAVEEALRRTGLEGLSDSAFATLSVGQQQRVTIARALAQLDGSGDRGSVLVADEPFSAMDPAHCHRAAGILTSLGRAGVSVLLVLHDFTLARRMADRAILLTGEGRVASAGAADDVFSPTTLESVFGVEFHECTTPGGPALIASGPG